ncbi:MAG: hypothetical protein QOG21_1820 [Actinomycetota bacterium]|nr:hypothetical protein [Actinomycetota bacterium]
MRSKLLICVVTLGVLSVAGTAFAEGNGTTVNSDNKLRTHAYMDDGTGNYVTSTCSTIGWKDMGQNGKDSPIDTNDHALVATICPGDFAEAYTTRSLNINKAPGDVKNISFDYLTSSITGAGQVYIAAVMNNGTILYLDPTYCSKTISSTWSRADFTGTTTAGACSAYDSNGNLYTSNGTENVLQVFQDANPGVLLSYTFMGFFGVTSTTTTYVVDRIALGTDKLYNYSNGKAFQCQGSEARC